MNVCPKILASHGILERPVAELEGLRKLGPSTSNHESSRIRVSFLLFNKIENYV